MMKKVLLLLLLFNLLGCSVHRIPVLPEAYYNAVGLKPSIGILKCTDHKVDWSESIFTRDVRADFVPYFKDSGLFSDVKCIENSEAEVDFIIEPKELLKITDEYSCRLDNQMLMTIGTLGIISTGCTTFYDSLFSVTDTNSMKQFIVKFRHAEKRRNGIPGFFSGYSKEWTKFEEPFPLDVYFKYVAFEIFKKLNEIE